MNALPEDLRTFVGEALRRRATEAAFRSTLAKAADRRTGAQAAQYTAAWQRDTGAVRALGLIAKHNKIAFAEASLGTALGQLSRATTSASARHKQDSISERIQILISTNNVEEAARAIDGLLTRLAGRRIGVNWFAVVDMLSRWNSKGKDRVRDDFLNDYWRARSA